MKIKLPFPFKDIEEAYKNNEDGEAGFYPVGANNFYHGGVHLYSTEPVRAIADGELVAYHVNKEFITKEENDETFELSNSFVLLRHEYETPKGQKIEFYSLYMHLLPWNSYDTSKHKYPEFVYQSKFVVNTVEDGAGRRIRSEADYNTILGVIPYGAVVQLVSNDPPKWKPESKVWRKVKYRDKVGYTYFGKDNFVCKLGKTYQLNKKIVEPDPAMDGTAGINVRNMEDYSGDVLYVLPKGTAVDFKDIEAVVTKSSKNHYYQLDPAKYGAADAGYVYVTKKTFKNERTPVEPVLDKIVRLEKPIPVECGDILGYAGKYYDDNVMHFEIFAPSVSFMKNPKKDKCSKPYYKVKEGTAFKKKTYPAAEQGSKIDAKSICLLLTDTKKLNQGYYTKARQISIIPSADVWVKRTAIAPNTSDYYDGELKAYKVAHNVTEAYTALTAAGVPDENSKVGVSIKIGESLKYLGQKQGDYRLVRAKLTEGKRVACWINRDDVLADYITKSKEYWFTADCTKVYKTNPQIPVFEEDHVEKIESDTVFESDSVEVQEVFNEKWYGIKIPDTDKIGWVAERNGLVEIIDPYDWTKFFEILKDVTTNGYCDVKELIQKIEKVKQNKEDNLLDTEEIKRAVNDPVTAKYLRHLVVNDKTEWSTVTDEKSKKYDKYLLGPWWLTMEHIQNTIVEPFKPFQFWDEAQIGISPSNLYFFHPVAFIEHVRKLNPEPGWIVIAKKEIGQKEIKGSKHNKRILEYHDSTTFNADTDEVPWCSSFVNWVITQAGYNGTNSSWAKDWIKWGRKMDKPVYGAICTIDYSYKGEKGGHVGFVVGKEENYVYLLGGNQGDQVKVSKYKTKGIEKYYNYVIPEDFEPGNSKLGPYTGEADEGSYAATR